MNSPATSRPGLIPVLALLLVGLNLRPVLAVVSLLTDSIRASNGMSFEQIGWLTSLPMMAMGLIAMAGGLVYRMGYRRGVAIGLALTAASALAKLASHEPLWLMGSSVAAGLGIGIVQSLIPGYIKTRFPHRVDLLMGLYVSMIMGGAALAAASASALLHWLDWQGTMAFWAVLSIPRIATAATPMRRPPAAPPRQPRPPHSVPGSTGAPGCWSRCSACPAAATRCAWRGSRRT